LTLETSGAFFAADALRATGFVAAFVAPFVAAFFAFTGGLGLAAVFFAARRLTAVRAEGLAAAALLALGLDGDFAFAARFALFAAGLAFERDVDRLNPFVRLLLMCGISKGCSPERAAAGTCAAYHTYASISTETSICGCFTHRKSGPQIVKCANREKLLMVIVGLC
jgi:hypothetical protein